MLEPLGLDQDAELLYRMLLTHPDEGPAWLADRLSWPLSRVQTGLAQLSSLALVRGNEDTSDTWCVVSPEMAMDLYLARQQSDLAAQQAKVEESRVAAAQLIAHYSSLHMHASDAGSERLIGAAAIRERLAVLGESIQREVMTLAPGGAHEDADLAASREPNARLLARGVRIRTVYVDSILRHQPTLDHVSWINEHGGLVRTAPTLPVRMIIVDRQQAILPVDTDDGRAGISIVRGQGTVMALIALFEGIWETAAPLGVRPPQDDPRGLPRQEADVLRLLTAGLTDEAIAKRLGVSHRTARRIASHLMHRLGAQSRFQAGVYAVQDAWLPPTR